MRGSSSSSLRLLLLFSATTRTIFQSAAFQSRRTGRRLNIQRVSNCGYHFWSNNNKYFRHAGFRLDWKAFGTCQKMKLTAHVNADTARTGDESASIRPLSQPVSPYIELCPNCRGEGKISKIPSKKERIRYQRRIYQRELELGKEQQDGDQRDIYKRPKRSSSPVSNKTTTPPPMPRRWDPCHACDQTGLSIGKSHTSKEPGTARLLRKKNPPVVAIVGGGIGGMALAVALKHRGIPFRVFEKDSRFDQRRQGYGLTLQQARRALQALGIFESDDGTMPSRSGKLLEEHAVTSTKHVVHTPDGKQVGEWGLRKWVGDDSNNGACSRGKKSDSDGPKKPTDKSDEQNNAGNETRSSTALPSKASKPRVLRAKNKKRRQNLHVPRQILRYALWESLKEAYRNDGHSNGSDSNLSDHATKDGSFGISWGHKLIDIEPIASANDDSSNQKVRLSFKVVDHEGRDNGVVTSEADLVVGCDGIRSSVRQQFLERKSTPLRYLNCVVVLGICPLSDLLPRETDGCSETPLQPSDLSPLLDGKTVFQTADGTTRIYLMPYSRKNNEYMWQLSFPVEDEECAKDLSRRGSQALKEEALKRCKSWHVPVPQILEATPLELVSGYPVYDRDVLSQEDFITRRGEGKDCSTLPVTLLGDAAHPMSPFKGQGANQALLDALSLARTLYRTMTPFRGRNISDSEERDEHFDISKALEIYENEMIERSSEKVRASSEAARFLHTSIAIQEGNVTRGAAAAGTKSDNDTIE